MHKNLLGMLMAVSLVLGVGLGCSALSDETDAANKLVDEGNVAITEGMKQLSDAQTKLAALGDAKQLSESPKIATDLINVFDQAQANCKKAAAKFDEASKLKVGEKFKEYLSVKMKEFNKRAELIEALKGIPQAYIELKGIEGVLDAKRLDAFKSKTDAANDKAEGIAKEANDLADQAKRIQQENPTIFKES